MAGLTTRKAFYAMIKAKGIGEVLGVSDNTIYYWRSMCRKNKIKLEEPSMEYYLKKAGWKVVQEREWESGGG